MNYNRQAVCVLITCFLLSACSSMSKQTNLPSTAIEGSSTDIKLPEQTPAQLHVADLLSRTNQFRTNEPAMSAAMLKQFKLAVVSTEQQEYSEALTLLSDYLTDNSVYSDVWLLRGDIATGLKQHAQASDYYQKALEVNEYNYLALNRLAILFRNEGQFEQALSHYNQALTSWPGFALGYLNRGILLDLYMGKKNDALLDYQQYQDLVSVSQGKADKKVRGWIIDLTRQLKQ